MQPRFAEPIDGTPPCLLRTSGPAKAMKYCTIIMTRSPPSGTSGRNGGPRRQCRGGRSSRPLCRAPILVDFAAGPRQAVRGWWWPSASASFAANSGSRAAVRAMVVWAQPACLAAMRRLPPSRSTASANSRRSGSRTSRGSRRGGRGEGSGRALFMVLSFRVSSPLYTDLNRCQQCALFVSVQPT